MIRVLGCHGSTAARCHTTSFLLDDDILIDAGSGVGELRLDELARIDHILLSHSHLDHVLGIPLLADAVLRLDSDAALWRQLSDNGLDNVRRHFSLDAARATVRRLFFEAGTS